MLGFAALTVLSLLLAAAPRPQARQVRTQGERRRSGRCYVLVLGLGGWFAGALVVLTTLPTVPLDSELLAGLSGACRPAWGSTGPGCTTTGRPRRKPRVWPRRCAGALVGAWLGFMAVSGLYAIFTAIVGAAVGANLVVLVLDIARDRAVRDLATAKAPHRPALTQAGA